MRVMWQKTFHQHGECEVPDDASEEDKRQAAQDAAASQEIKTEDLDWGWTDFYSPQEGGMLVADDGLEFDEWFDI